MPAWVKSLFIKILSSLNNRTEICKAEQNLAVKEERRVLEYASDGLNGKIGCLGKPHCLDGL